MPREEKYENVVLVLVLKMEDCTCVINRVGFEMTGVFKLYQLVVQCYVRVHDVKLIISLCVQ